MRRHAEILRGSGHALQPDVRITDHAVFDGYNLHEDDLFTGRLTCHERIELATIRPIGLDDTICAKAN